MAVYKTTWFFEGIQPAANRAASSVSAWTETWYQTTTGNVDAALNTAITLVEGSWVSLRLGFLHALYQLKWCRVSDVNNPRLTKVAAIPGGPSGRVGPINHGRLDLTQLIEAAQVNCCVLCDVTVLPTAPGDRTHHRRILLRGLGSSMIDGNCLNTTSPAFRALVRFLNYVARGESPNVPKPAQVPYWQIRVQNFAVPYMTLPVPGGLVINPVNDRQIVVNAPLGALTTNSRVTVRGVTSPRGVNKVWTYLSGPPGGPYVFGKTRFDLAGLWSSNGSIQVVTPLYFPADQYTIIGMRDKHTGSSPFVRTRGRRRAAS